MIDDDDIVTNPVVRIDEDDLLRVDPVVTAPPPEHATLLADLGWLQLWSTEGD